jgi:hypothetical protein
VVPAQDHSAGVRRGLVARYGGRVPWRGGPSGGLALPSWWPTVHTCGGAGGHGSPMAPLLQGREQGHVGGGRSAPDKRNNGVAHRGGQVSVRWQGETGAATFRWRRMAHEG